MANSQIKLLQQQKEKKTKINTSPSRRQAPLSICATQFNGVFGLRQFVCVCFFSMCKNIQIERIWSITALFMFAVAAVVVNRLLNIENIVLNWKLVDQQMEEFDFSA